MLSSNFEVSAPSWFSDRLNNLFQMLVMGFFLLIFACHLKVIVRQPLPLFLMLKPNRTELAFPLFSNLCKCELFTHGKSCSKTSQLKKKQ